ncbi:hypothetical protein QNH90_25605, partial [Klebsiella pneumoniae]|uniref:hypothetical protein n=1 Tax=Klebsiella pneumoniae TaxID=573 RepID=UPI00255642BA
VINDRHISSTDYNLLFVVKRERPTRFTLSSSAAASEVYKIQGYQYGECLLIMAGIVLLKY